MLNKYFYLTAFLYNSIMRKKGRRDIYKTFSAKDMTQYCDLTVFSSFTYKSCKRTFPGIQKESTTSITFL